MKHRTRALVAILFTFISRAHAMEAGQKGSFAEIQGILAQEQQVEFATARYVLNPDDPKHSQILRLKFTVNEKGDAHIVMVNGVEDARATTGFVYVRLRNAQVYDPHHVGVLPEGVLPNSTLAKFIDSATTTGDGLMLHGQVVRKQADGTDQTVGSMTVMANFKSSDPRVSDRVVIFDTFNNQTSLDKIVGFDVRYTGR